MTKLYAGIDLGTSGSRLIIIDSNKNIKISISVNYPNPDIQTPKSWWDSICELFSRVPSEMNNNLHSLSIDGTSGTVLLVDDSGEHLTEALMYNDLRAIDEAIKIESVLPKTNGGQGASGSLARVLWLLKNDKNIQIGKKRGRWNGKKHICHQADFIMGRFSNNYKLSDENNCLKLGYDAVNQRWPIDELQQLGIDEDLLPDVHPAGEVVAKIDSNIALKLNLPRSLKLVSGTTDSIAAFIATGANEVGDAVTSLGSTLVLKLITDTPIYAPEYGVYSHRLNNQWLVGGASNAGSKILRHYFSQDEIDALTEQLDPNISTNLNYYPLLGEGERFPVADPNKVGNLSPRPDSDSEFFQGMLEGIAVIEEEGYKKLMELGANTVQSVRSVGGGSHNKPWTQIRKNCLKIDMINTEYSEAAYGSALLAFNADRNISTS